MSKKTEIYILDTNVLIGLGLFIPLKYNEVFWNRLEELIDGGQCILLNVVVNEIKYNIKLIEWCKKQKEKSNVTEIQENHRLRAVEINDKYPMINESSQKSEADTYIIAYAEDKNIGVFTREAYRDESDPDSLYKIPDTCKKLNVPCVRIPEYFFEHVGFYN